MALGWRALKPSCSAWVASLALLLACPAIGLAQFNPLLTTKKINQTEMFGINFLTSAPGDAQSLFLPNSTGQVQIMDRDTGELSPTPLLDTSALRAENGDNSVIFGLAFHPDFANNGKFYTSEYLYKTSFTQGHTQEIREYQVSADNPRLADPATGRTLFSFPVGYYQHGAAWMQFSPVDGYLYIAQGDQGDADSAQLLSRLTGKVLRVDVNTSSETLPYGIPEDNPFVGLGGREEIWARGVRNPWRNSFDRLTGDLYLSDVGENAFEEINFQPATSQGGENYGWNLAEGTLDWVPNSETLTYPLFQYDHSGGGPHAVVGGYVYRGSAIGGKLSGDYLFADYGQRTVQAFTHNGSLLLDFTNYSSQLHRGDLIPDRIISMGEDALGELYFVSEAGIYRIEAVPAQGDVDRNGIVDISDFIRLRNSFGLTGEALAADLNEDGAVDLGDFILVRRYYGTDSRSQALGGGAAEAVPEPGTWALVICAAMLGGAGLLVRSKRQVRRALPVV